MVLVALVFLLVLYVAWRAHTSRTRRRRASDRVHHKLMAEDVPYQELHKEAMEEERAGERFGNRRGQSRLQVLERMRQDGEISDKQWIKGVAAVRREHRL